MTKHSKTSKAKGNFRFTLFSRRPPEERSLAEGRHFALFQGSRIDKDEGGRVFVIGYLRYERVDLERLRERGLRLRVRVIGMLRLDDNISPALRRDVLEDVHVSGVFRQGRSAAPATVG